jgi:uncharacterized protein
MKTCKGYGERKFWLSWLASAALCGLWATPAQAVWINEIHYDNTSSDSGELVEIAGPAGTDLTGFSLVLYNGGTGLAYKTTSFSGLLPDQGNGFGTAFASYSANGIQNGAPDGVALVMGTTVVQFLSYEGEFTAADGPANGASSSDIGVAEDNSTLAGYSLQLTGLGSNYDDFAWTPGILATPGAPNTGQSFVSRTQTVPDAGSTMWLLAGALLGLWRWKARLTFGLCSH